MLTDPYLQSTSNSTGLIKTGATGLCKYTSSSSPTFGEEQSYQVPSECLLIHPPASYPSIQGLTISLRMNQPGSVILPGNYTILPYNVIDCKSCGRTALDGWVEVHSIVNSNSPPNFCLGILYLYMESDAVSFPYLIRHLKLFMILEISQQTTPAASQLYRPVTRAVPLQ